ncbi:MULTISPECIES: pyrroline-5-carboxylate reductase [Peribacillus]|jgi:pyrroline-5-carboxylate reductase|uniref:pyrroline-5-carboxylate reductase n=1 Tax=Peribacillus TaxID=2675229 RepID=UPI0006AC4923|nr:pyrroline-5-carboxylate reductase [Peribacillus frigoritolerans]KOR77586.1 pyrroline-5-carboxylate reductase [Bacillus sp. FJAT-21352]MEC0297301.1 pyrroline-5-carboxylate reductase [Peribacillus castrilensis]MCY9136891.1 pyrroline-5-carboxylate reductase [Peribacillus frigoritolerans]MDF2000993.1 pyrroline-5-carboxylate reductase [Peribacillus frigoritolerans]MEC0343139.1 pyrroline-5-carboxylate reductase [Peribacillus castrilensis]
MNKKIGFIGCGKMGEAMLEGMLHAEVISPEGIMVSTASAETKTKITTKYNVKGTLDNKEVAGFADFLFLGIQPAMHKQVLEEVKNHVKEDAVIITMAAGITVSLVENSFEKRVKVVRTMPNTPSLVGEGMTAMCINDEITDADIENVTALLNSFGKTEILHEDLMDAVPAISGSSPAYVYMFIEALADGGVRDGIPRKQAYRMAAQAVMGAAKMVLETERHPAALKDDVCTPGGSTISAVAALEENQLRSSILQAMKACTDKTKGFSK